LFADGGRTVAAEDAIFIRVMGQGTPIAPQPSAQGSQVRSRSSWLKAIRSVSMGLPATDESGHFHFAQTGHSHFAATLAANSE
jgi:hypothetical protein